MIRARHRLLLHTANVNRGAAATKKGGGKYIQRRDDPLAKLTSEVIELIKKGFILFTKTDLFFKVMQVIVASTIMSVGVMSYYWSYCESNEIETTVSNSLQPNLVFEIETKHKDERAFRKLVRGFWPY